MVFSADDRVLIKVLRQEKGYGALQVRISAGAISYQGLLSLPSVRGR